MASSIASSIILSSTSATSTVASTTVSSRASASASHEPTSYCSDGNQAPDLTNHTESYCGIAFEGLVPTNTTEVMLSCCNGAPLIFEDGLPPSLQPCNIYCDAVNQTTQQLSQCISDTAASRHQNASEIVCHQSAGQRNPVRWKASGGALLAALVAVSFLADGL